MRSLPEADPQNPGFNEPPSSLSVLLLYQDAATALRGKYLVDHLAGDVNLAADFRLNLWRFDLLNLPALRQLDAEESLNSDIVVLSAKGQDELPASVCSWLELWFARNAPSPRALILLSEDRPRHALTTTESRYFLEASARHAGVEVFSSYADSDLSELDEAIASIRYRAETTSVLLDETLHRPGSFRDWGINE
jgi:hypothetical protein